MTEQSNTYERLVAAFQAAEVAALSQAQVPDGGACNFDMCVVRLPGVPAEEVQRAAKEAGISVWDASYWGGKGCWFVRVSQYGQADRRSLMAQAACAAMEAAGFKASMYYQMD